jgi:hypothetical protein
MKSPKPATDTIYPHIKFWWYRTMLNFYPPIFMPCFGSVMTMNAYLVVWFQIVGINIYIKIRDDLFIVLTVHVMVAENLSYVLSFIWACVSKSIRFWIFLRILFQVRTDVKLDTFIVHGFVVISFCIRWISKMKAMVNNLIPNLYVNINSNYLKPYNQIGIHGHDMIVW